jgi:hypothetical protein
MSGARVVVAGISKSPAGNLDEARIEKTDAWRGCVPPLPPGCFLEVLILRDFKSLSPELVILMGLKSDFSELVILKGLRTEIC